MDSAALPRELMDAMAPPYSPSGRSIRRLPVETFTGVVMRIATGEVIHPTLRSFVDYFGHPGVTSVPIRGLPPSKTALAWLKANDGSDVIRAFASAATVVQRAQAR